MASRRQRRCSVRSETCFIDFYYLFGFNGGLLKIGGKKILGCLTPEGLVPAPEIHAAGLYRSRPVSLILYRRAL